MIKSVKFVSIPVKDQDKALEFYTKGLGFTADGQEDRIGTFTGVSFTTDNVVKTHAEYVVRGVEFSEGPTKQPWGTYAIFKDVDGNQFVLSQK